MRQKWASIENVFVFISFLLFFCITSVGYWLMLTNSKTNSQLCLSNSGSILVCNQFPISRYNHIFSLNILFHSEMHLFAEVKWAANQFMFPITATQITQSCLKPHPCGFKNIPVAGNLVSETWQITKTLQVDLQSLNTCPAIWLTEYCLYLHSPSISDTWNTNKEGRSIVILVYWTRTPLR